MCNSFNLMPARRDALATAPGHSCQGSTRGAASAQDGSGIGLHCCLERVLVDDGFRAVGSVVRVAKQRIDHHFSTIRALVHV